MIPTRTEFMHLPGWQVALFYTLAFLSVAAMLVQFVPRIGLWRQGRPLTWKPRYLRNVWTNVVGQRKVRAARKKSGSPLHLLIFFGFLTLFIGTTLLAINTYSPYKFHRGTHYLVYEFTLDVMGAAFLAGLLWALGRRIFWRPMNAAHAAQDTLALLLLLVTGSTGFLVEAARMTNDPKPFDVSAPVGHALSQLLPPVADASYVTIWWIHAAIVFTFFVALPRMRLKHLLLGVLSSAGSPDRMVAAMRTIPMEEVERTGVVGAAVPNDYSRWHLMSLDACMECGRCSDVCPATGVGKPLDPKKVVLSVRSAMPEGGEIGPAVGHDALWACTTCNACANTCPVLIRQVELITDARRNLVAEGRLHGSAGTMLRQTASTGHAWAAEPASREEWMDDEGVALVRDGAEFEWLFWVGCAGSFDPGALRTTRAVARLLHRAGVSFACLGREERCTGDAARRVGDEFLFQELAASNIATLERHQVKRIVTACPHCLNTLANEYPDLGGHYKVLHHTQLLSMLVAEGRLKSPGDAVPLAYHDPCYLARANGITAEPRLVAGRANVLEPERAKRDTLCCGAGGGRLWMDEPAGQRPGDRRVAELLSTGAKAIGVACPFCRIMLDSSVKNVSEADIHVRDVSEILLEANR